MSAGATTCASSPRNWVHNAVHAENLGAPARSDRRTFTLPTLRFTLHALVDEIAEVHAGEVKDLLRFVPQWHIETLI